MKIINTTANQTIFIDDDKGFKRLGLAFMAGTVIIIIIAITVFETKNDEPALFVLGGLALLFACLGLTAGKLVLIIDKNKRTVTMDWSIRLGRNSNWSAGFEEIKYIELGEPQSEYIDLNIVFNNDSKYMGKSKITSVHLMGNFEIINRRADVIEYGQQIAAAIGVPFKEVEQILEPGIVGNDR